MYGIQIITMSSNNVESRYNFPFKLSLVNHNIKPKTHEVMDEVVYR